jgi:CTP synthase
MRFSGLSPDGRLVEIAEIANHPFMVASQFHPEFLSRPNRPHPLFVAFLDAVRQHANVPTETEDTQAQQVEQAEIVAG